jgi:S-formylglutathione hydrolase FrmB
MQDVNFHSAALNRDAHYRVYLPVRVTAPEKLPAVYLLHGCGQSSIEWSNYTDAGKYAARGLILVIPDGECSYWVNAESPSGNRYENYILNDLVYDVEDRFPVLRGREHRAVIGVSMGGYAAMYYALTRPDVFIFAGGLSPAVDVPSRKFSYRHWSQRMRFRDQFGPDGSDNRRNHNPFVLVEKADPKVTPFIFLGTGKADPLYDSNRRFEERLKARGFQFTSQTKPGGHDWAQWDEQLPKCFDALFAHLASAEAKP